jgi:hypothetical protein
MTTDCCFTDVGYKIQNVIEVSTRLLPARDREKPNNKQTGIYWKFCIKITGLMNSISFFIILIPVLKWHKAGNFSKSSSK